MPKEPKYTVAEIRLLLGHLAEIERANSARLGGHPSFDHGAEALESYATDPLLGSAIAGAIAHHALQPKAA